MAKMKEDNVRIMSIRQLEDKEEYAIVFMINDLKPEERKRILKRQESGFLNAHSANFTEIVELNGNLLIEEIYEKSHLQDYPTLLQLTKTDVFPERLDNEQLEMEIDLCMAEQDMCFRMELARKSREELKEHHSSILKTLTRMKEENQEKTPMKDAVPMGMVEGFVK